MLGISFGVAVDWVVGFVGAAAVLVFDFGDGFVGAARQVKCKTTCSFLSVI